MPHVWIPAGTRDDGVLDVTGLPPESADQSFVFFRRHRSDVKVDTFDDFAKLSVGRRVLLSVVIAFASVTVAALTQPAPALHRG